MAARTPCPYRGVDCSQVTVRVPAPASSGFKKAPTSVAVGTNARRPPPEPSRGIPARGAFGCSAFTHEPLLVRDYRGCQRHRFGRTVDTLKAGMLEAARPRPVDPDHLPNRRRSATRPDDAIALPSFDLPACTHDDPLPYMRERAAKPR